MTKGINVIKHYGRPMEARDLSGVHIHREERVFLASHNEWYGTLDYDNHFVYKTDRKGTSLLCTCGGPAVTVGYDAYKQYCSYRGQVVACLTQLQTGRHSDGSS